MLLLLQVVTTSFNVNVLVKADSPPVPAPVPSPTEPTLFCNICPNGAQAMGTGSIGGSSCQDLDRQGRNSELTFLQCLDVQNGAARSDDPCGCGLLHPTPSTFLHFRIDVQIVACVFGVRYHILRSKCVFIVSLDYVLF